MPQILPVYDVNINVYTIIQSDYILVNCKRLDPMYSCTNVLVTIYMDANGTMACGSLFLWLTTMHVGRVGVHVHTLRQTW